MKRFFVLSIVLFTSRSFVDAQTQLKIFDPSRMMWSDLRPNDGQFHAELRCAVLIHGWNPPADESNCIQLGICSWNGDLNQNTDSEHHWTRRFAQTLLEQGDFNIIAWDALEEFNVPFFEALDKISGPDGQARKLANALKMALPVGYNKNMQIFAHSLGSFLGGLATLELYVRREESGNRILTPEQLSLFDPSNRIILNDSYIRVETNLPLFVSLMRSDPEITMHHPTMDGMYIDVYHGTTNVGSQNASLFVNVPGFSHQVHDWYRESMGQRLKVISERVNCNASTVIGQIAFAGSALTAPEDNPDQNQIRTLCAGGTPEIGRSIHCSLIEDFDTDFSDVFSFRGCMDSESPSAEAGPDQVVAAQSNGTAEVRLDGSGSGDPNDSLLSFQWLEDDQEIASGPMPTVTLNTGSHIITLRVSDTQGNDSSDEVLIEVSRSFMRGDSNIDKSLDISDAIFTLFVLFLDGRDFQCEDSADTNDDGEVDLSDPIFGLSYNFLGGPPPPQPHPMLRLDRTTDLLGCDVY